MTHYVTIQKIFDNYAVYIGTALTQNHIFSGNLTQCLMLVDTFKKIGFQVESNSLRQ